jgi:hypothetical protein
MENDFGTPAYKLVRRDDPDTSHEAAESVDTKRLERLVYETISVYPDGCIQDEVLAMHPGKPYSSITARFRALLDKGYIQETGFTRPGKSGKKQRVLKVKLLWNTDENN